jgi:hypothetical protein
MGKFGNRAEAVVARLLENVVEQKTPPPQSSSVMYTAYSYFFNSRRKNSNQDEDTMPVADRSLLLLLLLGTQSSLSDSQNKWVESYRFAIANLSDHNGKVAFIKRAQKDRLLICCVIVVLSDIDGRDRRMHLISFKSLFEIFSR